MKLSPSLNLVFKTNMTQDVWYSKLVLQKALRVSFVMDKELLALFYSNDFAQLTDNLLFLTNWGIRVQWYESLQKLSAF